ncbi:MAG TPA: transglutaminaseTgpA domain-containing protein [Gaiellaceae bacterium]|nr:transglutaminaseTgpA domain-containing protein [Gaiellaceae bacterium]
MPAPEREDARPAWYALERGAWRDYVTLLHPPYTAWHLSYVAIGAALAPHFEPVRLWWGLAAFFLALGIAAHALDELNGRPLRTRIPGPVLVALAAAGLAGAAAIGVGAAVAWGYGLLGFVAAGVFLVLAYDLELFGGRFHTDAWFALAWGAFPALTGYFVEAQTIRAEAVLAAIFATALSVAQRVLSTPAREARRSGGVTEPRLEAALRALTVAVTALAAALVVVRIA